MPLFGWQLLTARERRVVALAGFVGELVYTGRQPPDLAFSPHDRRLAGPCAMEEIAAAAVTARDILQAQDRAWRRWAARLAATV